MIDLSGPTENVKSTDSYIQNMYDEYEIPIRLYQVQKTSKVILFAHGGGNIQGNFDTHDYLCRKIARTLNVDVVAIEYRLSPEYIFPTSLNDLLSVYCFLAGRYEEVYLAGDSAGGNLAAALNIMIKDQEVQKASGQILMYPLLDNNFSTSSYQQSGNISILRPEDVIYVTSIYTGCDCNDDSIRNNKLIYPALEQNLTIFPRTFIVSAGCDILLDSQVNFCRGLKEAGIACAQEIVAGTIHGFMQYGKFFDDVITENLRKISSWIAKI